MSSAANHVRITAPEYESALALSRNRRLSQQSRAKEL
jgi:hypothetical protein